MHAELIIIGAGPAGYTAAIYAARANRQPLLIQGLQPGGQLMITTDVENYPGFAEVIQGPWLMEQMRLQAEHVGTRMVSDVITALDLSHRPFTLTGDSGTSYTCDALILATGAQARWLGLPSEAKFRGYGVSACATCDAPFYRRRTVAVVGGGNTAVEEALHLTHFAEKVILIHRRDSLRAEKILQDRLLNHPKVEVRWNRVVTEILGIEQPPMPPGVTGLRLQDPATGATEDLPIHGLFVAIGHDPATGLVKGQVQMDAEGYVQVAPHSTATSVPGVFAAGDVADKVYRQAITAAGMGCMAALEADRWLSALPVPQALTQAAE